MLNGLRSWVLQASAGFERFRCTLCCSKAQRDSCSKAQRDREIERDREREREIERQRDREI